MLAAPSRHTAGFPARDSFRVENRSDEVALAETFGEVARVLAQNDLQTTLDRIVGLAVENLEACEYAGISLVEKGRITSPSSSNDIPRMLDALQAETGEGPCVDTVKDQGVFWTGQLEHEKRWPEFSSRAHRETGVRSILSLRLFVEDETMGALNLYSSLPDAFDDDDVAVGSVFAAHAAVALSAARRQEHLERKAETRDIIGRAKGILMARSGVTDDDAFAMLVRASQRMNVRLRDVARRIAEQHHSAEPPQPA